MASLYGLNPLIRVQDKEEDENFLYHAVNKYFGIPDFGYG